MSELGESVFNAFTFLNDFLKDVSKLVTIVEEKLTNKRLMALGDAATFWDHSRAYYAPTQWMPQYIVRHYSAKLGLESKRRWKAPWVAFFNVYIAPDQTKEPVAVWGVATQNEIKNIWNILKNFGLYQKNPDYLNKVPTLQWETTMDLPESLSSFKYMSINLLELNNAQKVDEIVIEPLLLEIKELRRTR